MEADDILMIPGPTDSPLRIEEALAKRTVNHRDEEFHKLYEEIVEDLKNHLFLTKNDVFPIHCSGTGGVEAAISSVADTSYKALVFNNGEFGNRMGEIFESKGVETVRAEMNLGDGVDGSLVESYLQRHPDVKYVGLVFNETSTGVRNSLEEVADVMKNYEDRIFIVDAISAIGGDRLLTDEYGIDFVIGATQKCLACQPVMALVSISDKAWEIINGRKPSSVYFDFKRIKKFYDQKRETPFTPPLPFYYALHEALRMLKDEGLENRIARHYDCASYLRQKITEMGLELFIQDEKFASKTVTAITLPPFATSRQIRDYMKTNYGVHIAGGFGSLSDKLIRIGTIGMVTRGYVDRTTEALKGTLQHYGILQG